MWTTGTASHIIPIFVWMKHMFCGNVRPTRKGIPVFKGKTNRGNCKTVFNAGIKNIHTLTTVHGV